MQSLFNIFVFGGENMTDNNNFKDNFDEAFSKEYDNKKSADTVVDESVNRQFSQQDNNHYQENGINNEVNNRVNSRFDNEVNNAVNCGFNGNKADIGENYYSNTNTNQQRHNSYRNDSQYLNNQNPYITTHPQGNNPYGNGYSQPNYYGNTNTPNQQANMPKYMAYMSPVKKVYDRIDKIFALMSILLGYFFIQATFLSGWYLGIGTSIMFLTGHIAGYIYIKKRNLEIDNLHKIISVVIILLSLSFTYYSNPMAVTVNFIFLVLANAYWIYTTGTKPEKRKGYVKELCDSFFIYPFTNFGAVFNCLFGKNKTQKSGNGKWILLGLCIAVPIVAIVSTLLMGDELFKAMFSAIFDEFFIKIVEHLWYAVVGLPIALIIFSLWYTKHFNHNVNTDANGNQTVTKQVNYHIAPPALMYSIVIPLCILYFLYLISQISYFISFIADNLLPEGFTIVDYARSGFFELCVVAVINLIIIFLLIILTKQQQGETENGVRIITIIMSVFTIIMICTALYKMFTYINEYGYTAMRINTSAFMIFLLIVFGLIIAKQIHNKINLFPTVIALLMIFMCGYTLADTDGFIARENIRRYQLGEIDWMGNNLVRRLDDSAYKYIIPFAADKNNGLSSSEQHRLKSIINDKYYDYEDYPMSFNVNRFIIYQMIDEYGFGENYDKYGYYNEEDYNYDSLAKNYDYAYSEDVV